MRIPYIEHNEVLVISGSSLKKAFLVIKSVIILD
jgi:hypothetical protein